MNGWKDEKIGGGMNGWKDEKIGGRMNGWKDEKIGGGMNGWKDEKIGGGMRDNCIETGETERFEIFMRLEILPNQPRTIVCEILPRIPLLFSSNLL